MNQPDNYFFFGGSKSGLGYNEDQYSLPRWQDVTISRMTVYDQTYRQIPSQGWMVCCPGGGGWGACVHAARRPARHAVVARALTEWHPSAPPPPSNPPSPPQFVPLIDYHGGGADAAFEPMSAHLAEYNMALGQYLGAGVAACYRGTRLYDTPAVQAVVAGWVAVYKKYRAIITSDLIHVRRPDGQSIDGWLHANAQLDDAVGFAVFFNPTGAQLNQTLRLPLYYTGIETTALVSQEDGPAVALALARDYSVALPVSMPPQSVTWFAIRKGA